MDYAFVIQRAADYIETNLNAQLTLNRIAREAAMSPYHFHRVFRAWTGRTLMEYVRQRRLSLAAEELISSNQCVIDVALASGYESHEGFTRAFRRRYGVWLDKTYPERTSYFVGASVPQDAEPVRGLSELRISGGLQARTTHGGHFHVSRIEQTYAVLHEWIRDHGYRYRISAPTIEFYDTLRPPSDDGVTEIYEPIEEDDHGT
jgi:AraC-like DNA-binding protein